MHKETLRVTSCMAPNCDYMAQAVVTYLAEALAMPVSWVADLPWEERLAALDRGEIDVGWICGAPYIQRATAPQPTVELLAAPVWRGEPYADRPVYYSAVVVGAAAPYQQWADLRGTTWGYNEPNSLSGYHVLTHHLATLGERVGYFGCSVAVGSHQRALQLIARGELDVAVIDTTVLAQALVDEPALATQLRTLLLLGPNPMPPWVVSTRVPMALRERLRKGLLAMGESEAGRLHLSATPIARFAAVAQAAYLPIAEMINLAQDLQPARQAVVLAP